MSKITQSTSERKSGDRIDSLKPAAHPEGVGDRLARERLNKYIFGSRQAPKPDPEAERLMLLNLAESDITERQAIKQLRFVPLSRQQTKRLTGKRVYSCAIPYYAEGALVLPVMDSGKPFVRVRFLETHEVNGMTGKRTPVGYRYWQPKGTSVHVYVPPIAMFKSWHRVRVDKDPVAYTEGEKKAIVLCLHGVHAMGLGGVNSYSDRKHGEALLREIRDFTPKDRRIELVMDSDAATNFKVQKAEFDFAKALVDEGANVFYIRLPKLDHAKKTGIDDFLLARTIEDYWNLPRYPYKQDELLRELFDAHKFIHNPVCYFEVATGVARSDKHFDQLLANRLTFAPKGKGMEEVPYSKLFKKSAARPDYERLDFVPGQGARLGGRGSTIL